MLILNLSEERRKVLIQNRININLFDNESLFALQVDIKKDERGTFTRVWESNNVFDNFNLSQASIVTNPKAGTLRGLHYQNEPYVETKIIQCTSGKIFDVIVDLRPSSKTKFKYTSIELGPECEFQGLIVPKGYAHGYITLKPNSSIIYFMDAPFSSEHAMGLRWNDPQLNIPWPIEPTVVSKIDTSWPTLEKFNEL